MAGTPNRYTLHIDWTKCDGRGLCTELIPDLLARDKWGYPIAKTGDPAARSNVAVPGSRLAAAGDAVDLCPLLALKLIAPTDAR
ncbi:MAG: ferredoxin [Actinomycetota bacterium]|jgi:ferredoxin|nr:ferredoxin [Actinomycetota bacterium]